VPGRAGRDEHIYGDQRHGPAPVWIQNEDALDALPTSDLDDGATAYLEDARDRLRALMSEEDDAAPSSSLVDAFWSLHRDIKPFVAEGASDSVTAILRLGLAVGPLIAARLDQAHRPDEAINVMRQLFPALLILTNHEVGARVAFHVAAYASQEFKLEAVERIEQDLLAVGSAEPGGVLARAALVVRSSRLFRVGDAVGAIDAARAAISGQHDWVDGYAEVLLTNAQNLRDGEPPADAPAREPRSILEVWMSARTSRDNDRLTSLVAPLVRWGRRGSAVEQAMAYGEAAAGLIDINLSQACHYMFSAAESLASALAVLRSDGERASLLSALPQLRSNILSVMLRTSRLGVESACRAAYDWFRQLAQDPELPEERRELTLVELVELHSGLSGATPPPVWTRDNMGFDVRFLQFDSHVAAGWRFMFDAGDNVLMEPFALPEREAANLRHLTDTPDAAIGHGEVSALRRALFGPWIDHKIEVEILHYGAVLVRQAPEIAALDLSRLSVPDGTRTAWPELRWDWPIRAPNGGA
jgi:hypothetical protein